MAEVVESEQKQFLQELVRTFIDALQRLPFVQRPTPPEPPNTHRIQPRESMESDKDIDDSPSFYLFQADPYDRHRTDSMMIMDRRGQLSSHSAVYPTQSDMEMARRIDKNSSNANVQGLSHAPQVPVQAPANLAPHALQRAGHHGCGSINVAPEAEINSGRMMERRRDGVVFPYAESPLVSHPFNHQQMILGQVQRFPNDHFINQVFPLPNNPYNNQPFINQPFINMPHVQPMNQASPGQFNPFIVNPPPYIYVIPGQPNF